MNEEILPCPKCNSTKVTIHTCWGETINLGWGVRVHCNECDYEPPECKWQWHSTEKAIKIWNKYKRKGLLKLK